MVQIFPILYSESMFFPSVKCNAIYSPLKPPMSTPIICLIFAYYLSTFFFIFVTSY